MRDDSGRSPRSRRTVGRRAPRVRDDSGRSPRSQRSVSRRARSGSREPKLQESCLQVRRVVCVTNAPVPQGTTALSTPPFVRAGYGCRNNTTVLKTPRNRGVGTPRVCRPADYLPSGTVGQWPPATGQWWNERAATQKPTSERRNSRSNLGARGGDPRTLASWRHLFSASCRGKCLRYGYKFQADTLRDGMSLVGFRNWTIGPYIPVRVTYAVLRSRRAPCGPRQLYAVSLLYANAPGLFGGRGEMAMAVPCCPLRGSAACGSESCLMGSLCSVSVVISNGLQPSLEALGQPASGSTVGCKPGHDSPWTLLRAPTQSGGPQATTRLSTVGCEPGHDTSRTNSVPASTGKTSTETSVRRSVTFNPQGWDTVFGRYPREVSRSTTVDAGDTYWAYGSTQWY